MFNSFSTGILSRENQNSMPVGNSYSVTYGFEIKVFVHTSNMVASGSYKKGFVVSSNYSVG
jgi:hypothetical protein